MKCAKRLVLARNAALVLGNVGTRDDVATLKAALKHDEPLVREHAAWAIEQIHHERTSQAERRVSAALERESRSPPFSE